MQTRLLLALLVAGCVHSRPVEYTGSVRVTSHELVPINPDVKVVADADEPLFFARGSYWLFHDGSWYSAPQIGDRWVETKQPPVPVVQIDQPFAYTRYRRDHDTTATVEVERQPTEQPAQQPRRTRESLEFER